ncbi:hypothetical protein ACPXBI_26655, partial [Escherichia coli]
MSISEMKKWTIIFASLMLLVLSVVGASKWICPYISRHLLSLNPLLA